VARYLLLGGVGSAAQIVARLDEDAAAAQVWGEAVEALARGIVSLIAVLDPAVVSIGGGLSRSGLALLEPLRQRVENLLTWRAAPVIQLSSLGSHAGLIGAANLAWKEHQLPQTFTAYMLRDLDNFSI
jgi:glucokinase